MELIRLTWADIEQEAQKLAQRTSISSAIEYIYGVPSGGAPVALMVARHLDLEIVEEPIPGKTLIVDDLVDSGSTLSKYRDKGYAIDTLYRKPHSPQEIAPNATLVEGWLAFPWEKNDGDPTDAVIRLLEAIGEDPTRDGLLDTPKRYVKAMREMTRGYSLDPSQILSKTFEVDHDELIVIRDVEYWSLCEHHLLPFHGTATIGYVPNPGTRVVGLSKLARLLEAFSTRLQVQERMTNQIAGALWDSLDARAVGVVVEGIHSCMAARGIQKQGTMITSCLLGDMRTNDALRAEFLSLSKMRK